MSKKAGSLLPLPLAGEGRGEGGAPFGAQIDVVGRIKLGVAGADST